MRDLTLREIACLDVVDGILDEKFGTLEELGEEGWRASRRSYVEAVPWISFGPFLVNRPAHDPVLELMISDRLDDYTLEEIQTVVRYIYLQTH